MIDLREGSQTDLRRVKQSMEFNQVALFTRAEALADGYSDNDLRRARNAKQIFTIRPGCYVTKAVHDLMSREDQHLLLVRAVMGQSCRTAAMSHVSAAVALGIVVWEIRLDQAQLTVDRRGSSKSSRRRMLHGARLPADDFATADGLRITTAARTVVDLARTLDFEKAVCAGDSALNLGIVTKTELNDAVEAARGTTGLSNARQAVRFMSGRSESVGESRSRIVINRQKLPNPKVNEWVFDRAGNAVGRVDFLFDGLKVIGEFDGAGKYGEEVPRIKKLIFAEKARENRLRALGWLVVRWDWNSLANPDELGDLIRNALDLASQWPTPAGRHSSERS